MNNIKILSLLGLLEGISFLLFAVTMPMKYYYEMPTPNKILGMVHGGLFLAYILLVVMVTTDKNWGKSNTIWALLASVIPFGTFVAEKKIFSKYS